MSSLPLPILDTSGDEQLGDQLVGEGGYVCAQGCMHPFEP